MVIVAVRIRPACQTNRQHKCTFALSSAPPGSSQTILKAMSDQPHSRKFARCWLICSTSLEHSKSNQQFGVLFVVRSRSAEPVLTPELLRERQGIVANVVLPTATRIPFVCLSYAC